MRAPWPEAGRYLGGGRSSDVGQPRAPLERTTNAGGGSRDGGERGVRDRACALSPLPSDTRKEGIEGEGSYEKMGLDREGGSSRALLARCMRLWVAAEGNERRGVRARVMARLGLGPSGLRGRRMGQPGLSCSSLSHTFFNRKELERRREREG